MNSLTLSSAQVDNKPHFDLPVIQKAATAPDRICINRLVKPALLNLTTAAASLAGKVDPKHIAAATRLNTCLTQVMDAHDLHKEHALQDLQKLLSTLASLSDEGLQAVMATELIFQELCRGTYTKESAKDLAACSARLLFNHLSGGALRAQEKVDDLFTRVFKTNEQTLEQRDPEEVNNPAFVVSSVKTHEKLGFLKQMNNEQEASHTRVIEGMKPYHAPTRLLVGYESDALLGFDRSPALLRVTCTNHTGGKEETKESALQDILHEGKPLGSAGIFQKGGALLLKGIDKGFAHMTAISGLIKGLAAGHMDNYVFAGSHLYEIDHKECFVPFNHMPTSMKVNRGGHAEDLDKKQAELKKKIEKLQRKTATHDLYNVLLKKNRKEKELAALEIRLATERNSIQMGRMIILGLPQCEKPFEKAALQFLCHPSLQVMMQAHHASIRARKCDIEESALTAQKERLDTLQNLARFELEKEAIVATPRDFYFEIYGGRELYQVAALKNYPPLLIFNGVVGNSYRHYFKDLSKPETLPQRNTEKPANESDRAKIIFENFQELARA